MAERTGERERSDIAFVLPHLGPGGAQRVASILLNEWAARGLTCTLITTFDEPGDVHHLSDAVDRISLFPKSRKVSLTRMLLRMRRDVSEGISNRIRAPGAAPSARRIPIMTRLKRSFNVAALWAMQARARTLRRQLVKLQPRVVVSFLSTTNLMTLLATQKLDCLVIVSERNDPRRQALKPPFEALRQRKYPQADFVTANTEDAVESLGAFVPRDKLLYLPNPVFASAAAPATDAQEDVFLSIGRLVPQKGHEVMIEAFGRIAKDLPSWRIKIAGEGPLRDALLAKAKVLGLADRVELLGHVLDTAPLYRSAGLFVLPSFYEGMPNVLLEAMSAGLPSIVTNASAGPIELAGSDRGAVVQAGDVDALAAAMLRLANDASLRGAMSRRAAAYVEAYSLPRVMQVWGEMLRPAGIELG